MEGHAHMGKSKPIAEIVLGNIRIEFAAAQSPRHGGPMLYDIVSNGQTLKTNLFPEEVMRWIVTHLESKR